jgi:hypothetical protein
MSRRTTDRNELTIDSASETSIDMIDQKPTNLENDKNFWLLPEREEWPLIDYGRSEVKSAQELLFEVIFIYLSLKNICPFLSTTIFAGSLGK